MFHKDAPTLKFRQKSLNSCCFSSLVSAFASIKQIKAAHAISLRINESFTSEVGNRIHFSSEIMQNRKRKKGEQKLHYNQEKKKKKGEYEIFKYITTNVKLVHLMDSLGNNNNAISVVGSWIFDSNYEKTLVLNRASLDTICASSIGEEQAACFEKVYYSVRFISKETQLKKKRPQLKKG